TERARPHRIADDVTERMNDSRPQLCSPCARPPDAPRRTLTKEQPSHVSALRMASGKSSRPRFSKQAAKDSPSPWGEGRDENSPENSRIEPLNRSAPPLPSLSPALSGGEGGRRPGEGRFMGRASQATNFYFSARHALHVHLPDCWKLGWRA